MRPPIQVLAFLVIESKRARDYFCKMRAGRKGPMTSKIIRHAIAAQLFLQAGVASAADVHTTPQIELRAEHNDNFGLAPVSGPDSDVYGYVADALWIVDMATPRGSTMLRPRLRYQDFPDRDDLEKIEGFLDLRSTYRSERSTFDVIGHLSHQDLYNNETAGGDFDPTDPGGGGSDSGDIIVGETRDEFQLKPTFDHLITERTRFGLGLEYSAARYDADEGDTTKTDYDFGRADVFLAWALNPISEVSAGAYASRYEAKDDSEEIDAVGVELGYLHQWSEQVGFEAKIYFEENDITEFTPVPLEETTSNFGGYVEAYRKHEVSEWRMSIGRSFNPTGDRGKSEVDQFKLQYERQLSQRLSFRGAGRYETRNSLGGTDGGLDRDFARMDLGLRWLVTRNWYVGGGYAYMWEDQAEAPESGDNNRFFLTFGYQGLRAEATPQRAP
jgi:hypothetical protein